LCSKVGRLVEVLVFFVCFWDFDSKTDSKCALMMLLLASGWISVVVFPRAGVRLVDGRSQAVVVSNGGAIAFIFCESKKAARSFLVSIPSFQPTSKLSLTQSNHIYQPASLHALPSWLCLISRVTRTCCFRQRPNQRPIRLRAARQTTPQILKNVPNYFQNCTRYYSTCE
jgi:hypothetical protein